MQAATQNDHACRREAFKTVLLGLTCPLCERLFSKPHTAPQCGHTHCWDCVCDRLEGRGICKSECPTCHMPLWKKDLVSDSQLEGVVLSITSALPGLGREGVSFVDKFNSTVVSLPEVKKNLPGSGDVPPDAAAASAARLPSKSTTPSESAKRSSMTRSVTVKKSPLVSVVVEDACKHATSMHEIFGTESHEDVAQHPAVPLHLDSEHQMTANNAAPDFASNMQHKGLSNTVCWEGEPDWLAAYEPTQQATAQFVATQPCYFEALLAKKRSKECKLVRQPAAPCLPLRELQSQATQPLVSSVCWKRVSSEESADEAVLEHSVPERESGPVGQHDTTPLFTRRRNRSGTSASADPMSDRSNNPVSTAAALPSQHHRLPHHNGAHASPSKALAGACNLPDVNEAGCGGAATHAVQSERSACDASAGAHPTVQHSLGIQKHGDAAAPMHTISSTVKADTQEAQEAPTVSMAFQAAVVAGEALAEDAVAVNSRKRGRNSGRKGRDVSAVPTARPAKCAKQQRSRGRRRATKGGNAPARPATAPSPQNTPQDSHEAAVCRGPVQNDVAAPEGPTDLQHGGIGDGDCTEQPGTVAEKRMKETVPRQDHEHMHSPVLKDEGVVLRDATETGAQATAMLHPASRRRRARHTRTDPAFAITPCAGSGQLELGVLGSGCRVSYARDASPGAAPEKAVTCDTSAGRGAEHASDTHDPAPPGESPVKPQSSCDAGSLPFHHTARDEPAVAENENFDGQNEVAAGAEGGGGSQHCAANVSLLNRESDAVSPGQDLDVIMLKGPVGAVGHVAACSTGTWPVSRPREVEAGRSEHTVAALVHGALEHGAQQAELDGIGVQSDGMPTDGEGAGGQDDIKWEACATPEKQTFSCTLGPGFVSASELLGSQRSGRSHSHGALRSPLRHPVVLPFDALPEASLSKPDLPSQTGCPERAATLHSSEYMSDAAVAGGGFLPMGSPVQGSIDCPSASVKDRPGSQSYADMPSMADAEVVLSPATDLSPESDAIERPDLSDLDFGSLSQWTALSGAEGGYLMEHWKTVLQSLPKPMPREVAAAMHAELRGMQRAHATLSRLMLKLHDTNVLLSAPETASQPRTDPTVHHPSTAPSDRQITGPGTACGSSAAPEHAQAAAPQLQPSEQFPRRSTTQMFKSTATQDVALVNATDDAGHIVSKVAVPRERQLLSQCLLQGWTCGPSQGNCGTVAAQPESVSVAADADVPTTPPRDRSTQNAADCPPCIPDTPSESEGVPGNYAAGNGPARQQACHGVRSPSGSFPAVPPWQGQSRLDESDNCQIPGNDHTVRRYGSTLSSAEDHVADHCAAAGLGRTSGADTVLLHGFQLAAPKKKGRLSRRLKT